jgi:hypothetical protein
LEHDPPRLLLSHESSPNENMFSGSAIHMHSDACKKATLHVLFFTTMSHYFLHLP